MRYSNRTYNGIERPIFTSLSEVEKVLNKLEEVIKQDGKVSLVYFYELTGGLIVEGDNDYGWKDLLGVDIRRTRYGYELCMPAFEFFNSNPVKDVYDMLKNSGEEDAYDTIVEAANRLSEVL